MAVIVAVWPKLDFHRRLVELGIMPQDDKPQNEKPGESNKAVREKLAALGFRPEQEETDEWTGIGIIGGVRKPVEPSKPQKP